MSPRNRALLAALVAGGIIAIVLIIALAVTLFDRIVDKKPRAGATTPSACEAAAEPPAELLSSLDILDAHPRGAAEDDRFNGCDDSGGIAFAEVGYTFAGTRAEVMRFYKAAAAADGWRLRVEEPSPTPRASAFAIKPTALCFVKTLAGAEASLTLTFQRDLRIGAAADYWWTVRGGGC